MKTPFRPFVCLLVAALPVLHMLAQSIAEPDVPTALYERKGDKIVDAPAEDFALAKSYHTFTNKGPVVDNQRITILTHKTQYKVGEPVRVIHCLEALTTNKEVHVMGPKPVREEYVDGKLAVQQGPDMGGYYGLVISFRPLADFNYNITTYTFTEPGTHTIQWKGGGYAGQNLIGLESNLITLEVVEE